VCLCVHLADMTHARPQFRLSRVLRALLVCCVSFDCVFFLSSILFHFNSNFVCLSALVCLSVCLFVRSSAGSSVPVSE